MVLPLCCVKLSHLYDNPDINNKLRVNHSQVEEPFVEKVYSVPREILRDTITESSAPSVINPNQENDKNNKENIINLIESGNQEQNIIGVKQNDDNDNDNESDINLIKSGNQEQNIIDIKQNDDNDNESDFNLIDSGSQEQNIIDNDNNIDINSKFN